MDGCCGRDGYDQVFTNGFARRVARRYREKGLDRTRQRVVDFLAERGIEGASVLEIGGGVGEIQIELLRWNDALASNDRSLALLKEVPESERRTRVLLLRALVLTGIGRMREAAASIAEVDRLQDDRYSPIPAATPSIHSR